MSRIQAVDIAKNDTRNAIAPLVGLETFSPELAIETLRSFLNGDPEEHRETLEFLMQALDEGRPEGQKLFSEE